MLNVNGNFPIDEWVRFSTHIFQLFYVCQSDPGNDGVKSVEMHTKKKKHQSNLSVGAHSNKWIKERNCYIYNLHFLHVFFVVVVPLLASIIIGMQSVVSNYPFHLHVL